MRCPKCLKKITATANSDFYKQHYTKWRNKDVIRQTKTKRIYQQYIPEKKRPGSFSILQEEGKSSQIEGGNERKNKEQWKE